MRNRNFFRTIVLAAVFATVATINPLFAQFEPSASAPASVPATQAPAVATSSSASSTQVTVGLSKEAVQQIARETVASELKAAPYASADHTHGNNWVGGFALILALVAIGLVYWFRRSFMNAISGKLDSKGFDDWIKSVYEPAVAAMKKSLDELTANTKKADDTLSARIKALEPPDPKEAAKAEVDAAQKELDQAIKDKKFDLVPDLGKKLAAAQEKLAKLETDAKGKTETGAGKPDAGKGKPAGGELSDEEKANLAGKFKDGGKSPAGLATAVIALFCLALAPSAFGQTCYNTITGKTPGSVRQSLAVVGMTNEFVCGGSGAVEITKLDGSALYTPTVTKPRPLTFEFSPTAPGRAIIKVGGRPVSSLVITADTNQAFLVGGAVDLASAHRAPTSDTVARKSAAEANTRVTSVSGRLDQTQTKVGTLTDQITAIAKAHDGLDLRVRNLEDRPQVDIAPLQAKVAALEAELKQVKATANTALSTAQGADAKATDALNRYEAMGLARFKTGLFGSKTVVQATEEAQVRAEKAQAKANRQKK